MLYEDLQLHAALPVATNEVHGVSIDDKILYALRSLPGYGLLHVRRMTLLQYQKVHSRSTVWCEHGLVSGRYKHEYKTVGAKMDAIWQRLHHELPKLSHVRLDLFIPDWQNEAAHISGIARLAQGKNMKEVEINVIAATPRKVAHAARVGQDVKAQFEAQAVIAGKSMKVSTSLIDKGAELKRRLAEIRREMAELEG